MRYNKGAPLVIIKGVYTGASGWVIENDNPEREKLGTPYLVGFEHFDFGEGSEWFSEDYLMHLDELQKLQAENQRLKAALKEIGTEAKRAYDILHQCGKDDNLIDAYLEGEAGLGNIQDMVESALAGSEPSS